VPDAVIAFDFDPLWQIGGAAVRWETIGVAVSIFVALVIAGLFARRLGLRGDDLVFVVLGVVPGAVIGGRLGYVLLHPAFFGTDPRRIIDPAVGSLELTLGVVGGALTGAMVAALLDNRPGRWLHVGAVPMLVVVGLGKLSMVLGGSGQGQATSGDPATAYLGPGPWGSLGPRIPSIPSQALEGIASLALLVVFLVLVATRFGRRADGRVFLVALAGWAGVRLVVASTWRDRVIVGPLRAEQLIDLGVIAGSLVLLLLVVTRAPAADVEAGAAASSTAR
jgi:phosphatidylglycerol---prolipoprotein diacylglyceryl transferase